jgi:hypothetical protein
VLDGRGTCLEFLGVEFARLVDKLGGAVTALFEAHSLIASGYIAAEHLVADILGAHPCG